MVISVLEHSTTHFATYAVDRHTSGNETQTVICRGSFLAINNIAFAAQSEFKDNLFLLRT